MPISNVFLFVFPEDLCLRILAEFQVIHPAIPAAVRNMSGKFALASEYVHVTTLVKALYFLDIFIFCLPVTCPF